MVDRAVAVVLASLGVLLTFLGVLCTFLVSTAGSSAGLQNPNDETPGEVFLAIGLPAVALGLLWTVGSWAILLGRRGGYYAYLVPGLAALIFSGFLFFSSGPDACGHALLLTSPILLSAFLAVWRLRTSRP